MKKAIIGVIVIAIVCFIGVYSYTSVTAKNNFSIKQLSWDANGKGWTDNSKNNKYDVKFESLNGSDTKKIVSKKDTFNMKINSNIEDGNLNLKIYNDNRVIFEKDGSIGKKNIKVGKEDIKNLKVKITGKEAKGHIVINIS